MTGRQAGSVVREIRGQGLAVQEIYERQPWQRLRVKRRVVIFMFLALSSSAVVISQMGLDDVPLSICHSLGDCRGG
jgi:hypothetical protein